MRSLNENPGAATDNWTINKSPRKGNGGPVRGTNYLVRGTERPVTGTRPLLIARNPLNRTSSPYGLIVGARMDPLRKAQIIGLGRASDVRYQRCAQLQLSFFAV